MNMILFTLKFNQRGFELVTDFFKDDCKYLKRFFGEYMASVFCYKDQMHMHVKNAVSTGSNSI